MCFFKELLEDKCYEEMCSRHMEKEKVPPNFVASNDLYDRYCSHCSDKSVERRMKLDTLVKALLSTKMVQDVARPYVNGKKMRGS